MAHGTQALEQDEAQEQADGLCHPGFVVLDRDQIPEISGKAEQGKIDERHAGDQHPGHHETRQVRTKEWEKSFKDEHQGMWL